MARRARNRRDVKTPTWLIVVLGIVIFVTGIFLWSLYISMMVFLAPVIVAWIVDRSRERYLFRCVLAVNTCGAVPGIMALMFGDFWTWGHFTAIVFSPFYLFLAYGTASIGWLLFRYVPRVIGRVMARRAERRVARLRRNQEALVQEWGWKVAQGVSLASEDGEVPALEGGAEPLGMPTPMDDDFDASMEEMPEDAMAAGDGEPEPEPEPEPAPAS